MRFRCVCGPLFPATLFHIVCCTWQSLTGGRPGNEVTGGVLASLDLPLKGDGTVGGRMSSDGVGPVRGSSPTTITNIIVVTAIVWWKGLLTTITKIIITVEVILKGSRSKHTIQPYNQSRNICCGLAHSLPILTNVLFQGERTLLQNTS